MSVLVIDEVLNRINKKCKEKDISFLGFCNKDGEESQWEGSHNTYLSLKCNVCNFEWKTYTYHSFVDSTRGCKKCAKNLKYTTETWVKKCVAKYGNNFDYSDVSFKNNNTKVHIKCNKCGKDFYQLPYNHLRYGCRYCRKKENGKKKSLGFEKFIEKARKIHNNEYEYISTDYTNNHTEILIKCNKCGNLFYQRPIKHLIGHGCPKCNSSVLENEIRIFLKENNIKFEEQKRFKWLGKQSLDFYLPQYNIAVECQGIQHFRINEYFGGEKEFKNIIERDNCKRKLCEENGVRLLYYSNLGLEYPYKVFENKEELLKDVLT